MYYFTPTLSFLSLQVYEEEPTGGRFSPPTPNDSHHPHNYDDVNMATHSSILPPQVRTRDNLEGGVIPADQAKALQERYEQQKQQYEEREIERLKQSKKPKSEGNYYNPADALPNPFGNPGRTNSTGKSSPPDGNRRFKLNGITGGNPTPETNGFYTEVFDSLPAGEVQAVSRSMPKADRAFSDSSSRDQRKYIPGYEDVSLDDQSSSAGGSDGVIKPSSLPARSMDDLVSDEGVKRHSMPHGRRESAKEEVQLVDAKTRSFRISKKKGGASSNGKEHKGSSDGEGTDGDIDMSRVKEKEAMFELSDGVGLDSYALVNLTDKQKYRTEDDVMKQEGSGTPRHYSVKDKPPQPVSTAI